MDIIYMILTEFLANSCYKKKVSYASKGILSQLTETGQVFNNTKKKVI